MFMPILNVKVGAGKSAALTKSIAGTLSDLTARILHKKPEVTAIAIDYVDPDDWIVAGKSLSEHGKSSFYFDIKITDKTNSKEEKAQYIRESFDALSELLGNVHEESYIYVQDVLAAHAATEGRPRSFGFITRREMSQSANWRIGEGAWLYLRVDLKTSQ
jgi:4-oxalocrotonate tautomerase